MIFSSPDDIPLKCFREISNWLQQEWQSHVKNLPVNKGNSDGPAFENDAIDNASDDAIFNYANEENAAHDAYENNAACDEYDDSILNFMNEDKDAINPDLNHNEIEKNMNSKQGRKRLIGGPSEETFFTLSYSLRCFADMIKHMLVELKVEFVLAGRMSNDLIEHQFSLIRCLSEII